MGIPVMWGCQNEPWELAHSDSVGVRVSPQMIVPFEYNLTEASLVVIERLGVKRIVLDADTVSPELIGDDQCMVQLVAHP